MHNPEVIPIFVTTWIFNVTKQMLRYTALSLKSFSKSYRFITIFLFLICSGTIFGQTHSFSGTIGKYPIYFQMTIEGSKVDGVYFYKNKLVDLSLSGTYKSGMITLTSSDEYGADVADPETFKFKWPNKAIQGSWSKKGKQLPLKLNALTAKETGSPKCSNPHLQKSDLADLTKVKIGLFRLKEVDSVRYLDHIKIRHFEEVLTGITLFRIDSGMVAGKQKDANSYLEYLQISEFLEALSCAAYSTFGSDYDYGISDLSLSNELMCFSVFKTYFCGGAHPNEENYGVNYNLNTKEKLSASDFVIPEKETAFDDRVYTYLAKVNPELFEEEQRGESSSVYTDCNYHRKDLWQISSCEFVLTSEGIEMLPSFAHYASFCLYPEWAVIPYSELEDFIKPEFFGKLTRLKN